MTQHGLHLGQYLARFGKGSINSFVDNSGRADLEQVSATEELDSKCSENVAF